MNQTELLQEFDVTCTKLRTILEAKNSDYAQSSDGGDPFANFTACEKLDLCHAEVGLLIRMLDKWQRLKTLAKIGKLSVKGESGVDACFDLMGYSFLMLALLKYKEQNVRTS